MDQIIMLVLFGVAAFLAGALFGVARTWRALKQPAPRRQLEERRRNQKRLPPGDDRR